MVFGFGRSGEWPDDVPGGDGSGEPVEDAQPQPVPAELAEVPPGALLAELLDDIPVESVSGYDSVVVLTAAYRQLCRQQAVFYQALVETGLRAPGSASAVARLAAPGEFACEESRAALVWSRQRAQREYQLGFDMFVRFPQLGQALHSGQIDVPRVRTLIEWTEGLTDQQAATVIDHLLPSASGMVVGELIDEIRRLAVAIDPEWAERRYRAAVKTRRVRGFGNPDGTANLGGYAQPMDRVAAACARIDVLARACKRAGDRRRLDLIRSDLFVRMLDGSVEAMTDTEIVAFVLANPLDDLTGTPDPEDPNDAAVHTDADSSTRADSEGDGEPDDDAEPDDDGPPAGGSGGGGPRGRGPGGSRGRGDGEGGDGSDPGPAGAAGWAVPELRVPLVSLLDMGKAPSQLPGWGVVTPAVAGRLAATMGSAQWRWVVCDANGRAVDGGLVTARPFESAAVDRPLRDGRRGGIVEIAVSEADLDRLAGDPAEYGGWAPVMGDIWRQWRQEPRGRAGPLGRSRSRSGADQAEGEAGRRFPGARLRRWVQIRDRDCRHPCCRAPAATADVDHRVGWAFGGPTIEDNLGSVCRRDHRIKDEGGWQMHQPAPGVTLWTSPLGHQITSGPPVVLAPGVDPVARDDRIPLSVNSWPDACRCLYRPCLHDHRAANSSRGRGDGPGHHDEASTQYTEHSDTDRPLYDNDEPPF